MYFVGADYSGTSSNVWTASNHLATGASKQQPSSGEKGLLRFATQELQGSGFAAKHNRPKINKKINDHITDQASQA